MRILILLSLLLSSTVALSQKYVVLTKDDNTVFKYLFSEQIKESWTGVLSGFEIDTDHNGFQMMMADENIIMIEESKIFKQDEVGSWGLDRIDARIGLDDMYSPKGQGKGVDIFILDTGIRATHEDFKGRFKGCISYISGEDCDDKNGHGTHVASTSAGSKYGVAKKANIYAAKVLSNSGSGSTSGIVRAINDIVTNDDKMTRKVINMSLGGSGRSEVFKKAIDAAVGNGIAVVVAAGNSNSDACNYSPAFVPAAITVASTVREDIRSYFSNYGPCVDIFAPGSSIKAAWVGSDTDVRTISGTSMASPHVAGAAAIELGLEPGLKVSELSAVLQYFATKDSVEDSKSEMDGLLYVSEEDRDPRPTKDLFLGDYGVSCFDTCQDVSRKIDLFETQLLNDKNICKAALNYLGYQSERPPRTISQAKKQVGCSMKKNKLNVVKHFVGQSKPELGSRHIKRRRVCACETIL